MYQWATGVLGWLPSVFWDSTYWEYSYTLVGYMKFHRLGKWGDNALDHWSERDYAKAKEMLAEVNAVRDSASTAPAEVRQRLKEQRKKRGVESSR